MIIVPECEGYTKAILGPLSSLIGKCGFNILLNHGLIKVGNNFSSVDPEDIGEEDYGPFQPNVAYFLCNVDPDVSASNPLSITKMSADKLGSYPVFLELKKNSTIAWKEFPWNNKVYKNLVFYQTASNKSIGWYNLRFNILWISDIGNDPESSNGNMELVLSAIHNIQIGRKPHNKISIGADPEFEILDSDGNFVSASGLFADPNHDLEIGVDGHSHTGELRPASSMNPLKLSRNIKRLIRKININPSLGSSVQVCAGGGSKLATGGHLHFGVRTFPDDLKDALWTYVAAHVLKFQGALRNKDRSKSEKTGNDIVRPQPWGTEWRPLPSFIINEDVTKSVTCTSYAIVKSYFNGGLPVSPDNFYKELPLYKAYKQEIDLFVNTFVNIPANSGALERRDILKEWKQAKMNRKYTVVINCPYKGLASLFRPLSIKLKNPIKVGIYPGGRESIEIWNIPDSVVSGFDDFAHRHFVDLKVIRNIDEEGRSGLADDMAMFIPIFWKVETSTEPLFNELKELVRQAIVEYNKNA